MGKHLSLFPELALFLCGILQRRPALGAHAHGDKALERDQSYCSLSGSNLTQRNKQKQVMMARKTLRTYSYTPICLQEKSQKKKLLLSVLAAPEYRPNLYKSLLLARPVNLLKKINSFLTEVVITFRDGQHSKLCLSLAIYSTFGHRKETIYRSELWECSLSDA